MLQGIRDRAQGWIAWVVVILISIPFALWGVQEYFGNDPNVPVATVNGAEIPLAEYQGALQQRTATLTRQLGRAIEADSEEEAQVRKATLESLVEEQLLLDATVADGLRVSDQMVAQAITTNPAFVVEGRFDQAAYNNFLARGNYSPGRFEEMLRQQMLSQQLAQAFAGGEIVTEAEALRLRELQTQKRRFVELVIPAEKFLADAAVSDEAARAHFDANRSLYVSDEQVKLQYLVLDRQALERGIVADEDELMNLYDANAQAYTRPEQRRASHILLTIDDSRTAEAAAIEAQEIVKKLRDGADFAALASEHSADPGSADKGGDVGFFGKGLMEPNFEAAAFAQSVDEISDPVQTGAGYHIIKVTDIRPSGTKSFEEARPEVLAEYQRSRGDKLYYEQFEELSNLTYEQPDDLEGAAEALGLTLATSEFISRAGIADDPIWSDPRILQAAFSPVVLTEGENSEPVDLTRGKVVVMRALEHRPSADRSFDEVREEIVEQLRRDAAREQAKAQGTSLLSQLRAGGERSQVAGDVGASWSAQRTAGRNDFQVPEPVRTALFRMAHPEAGADGYDGAADEEGNFHVLALLEVIAQVPEATKDSLDTTRRGLAQLNGGAMYRAFVDALRAGADVETFSDRL